jgi:uncharacterized protein (TIGR00661 family)
MKILYAIQGTGNGHLSRARDIIPILQEFCQCDILVSGTQCDVELDVPVKYRLKGLSFWFGKSGGVDILKTLSKSNLWNFKREIGSLKVEDYDLVINDFEPVSAWACKKKNVPCISLSHQVALFSNKVPTPAKRDILGRFILRNYAPADTRIGFHFNAYDDFIFTPVIRKQVRDCKTEEQDYFTVYLPAYDDKHLVETLSLFGDYNWHIFSKHTSNSYEIGNISVRKITNNEFVADMANSSGVLCGAGFETPAEALFLNKKLMVIPMKGQYEQQCNAAALEMMGVPVIKNLHPSQFEKISNWLESDEKVKVDYPDQTRKIIRKIFEIKVQSVIWQNYYDLNCQLQME